MAAADSRPLGGAVCVGDFWGAGEELCLDITHASDLPSNRLLVLQVGQPLAPSTTPAGPPWWLHGLSEVGLRLRRLQQGLADRQSELIQQCLHLAQRQFARRRRSQDGRTHSRGHQEDGVRSAQSRRHTNTSVAAAGDDLARTEVRLELAMARSLDVDRFRRRRQARELQASQTHLQFHSTGVVPSVVPSGNGAADDRAVPLCQTPIELDSARSKGPADSARWPVEDTVPEPTVPKESPPLHGSGRAGSSNQRLPQAGKGPGSGTSPPDLESHALPQMDGVDLRLELELLAHAQASALGKLAQLLAARRVADDCGDVQLEPLEL